MTFSKIRLEHAAAVKTIAHKDGEDSWASDLEIRAAIDKELRLEAILAEAPAETSAEIAHKLRLALTIIAERGADGLFEERLRRLIAGTLADIDARLAGARGLAA